MADFVGLLKRTIDAQSNATPELRLRIYDRARETVEKKLSSSNVSTELIELQRRIVEKAIDEVEEFYRETEETQAESLLRDTKSLAETTGSVQSPPVTHRVPAHLRKNGFPEKELFLKPDVSAIPVESSEGDEQDQQLQPTSLGAVFALPDNADREEQFSEIPADGPLSADSVFSLGDKPEFVDSAFPPALEALSVEADMGEESFQPRELFSINTDLAQGEAETAYDDEAPIPLEEDVHAQAAEDVAFGIPRISDVAADPVLGDEDEYQSAPDFLIDDEDEAEGTAQLYPDDGIVSNGAFKEPVLSSLVLPADAGKRAVKAVVQKPAFVPETPAAMKTAAMQKAPPSAQNMPVRAKSAVADRLPEHVKPQKPKPERAGREMRVIPPVPERQKPGSNEKNDDFQLVANIFSQAAIREKKRSGKKRLLTAGGIIVAILCIVAAIVWFLTGFLRQEERTPVASESDGEIISANHSQAKRSAKITNRLMPNGQETNPGSAEGQGIPGGGMSETIASRPVSQAAEAVFYEARTSLLPETLEKGSVKWSLLQEKTKDSKEEMAIRGDVSIPGKDMMLRMTIRHNTDPSIPATYLIELIFIVPENFDGGAVDRVGQLLFKASEQSTGQELHGTVPFRIDDNFFILAMNAPKPFLSRNLNIMRQLPWMKLNIAYKNGRVGEFSLAKGEEGDAIFKQVLDEKRIEGENPETGTPPIPSEKAAVRLQQ